MGYFIITMFGSSNLMYTLGNIGEGKGSISTSSVEDKVVPATVTVAPGSGTFPVV